MKKILLILGIIASINSPAQNKAIEDFNTTFQNVILKRVAFTDYSKQLKSQGIVLKCDSLISKAVYRNNCEHIQDCVNMVFDHNDFFYLIKCDKELKGNAEDLSVDLAFSTNKRTGNDLVSNIDTLSRVSFKWSMKDKAQENSYKSKKEMKVLFEQMTESIVKSLGSSYSKSNKGKGKDLEWGYQNHNSRYSILSLHYDKSVKRYFITFRSDYVFVNVD